MCFSQEMSFAFAAIGLVVAVYAALKVNMAAAAGVLFFTFMETLQGVQFHWINGARALPCVMCTHAPKQTAPVRGTRRSQSWALRTSVFSRTSRTYWRAARSQTRFQVSAAFDFACLTHGDAQVVKTRYGVIKQLSLIAGAALFLRWVFADC